MSRRKSVISAVMLSYVVLLAASVAAYGQGAMRIARPVDGATVREVVNILVPASAVPEGGFITCIVDGRYQCATSTESDDGRYYVYRWNTKAVEVSSETGEVKGRPKDGKHVIVVQAYSGSDGKKIGSPAQVTVYVKNDASADMPSNGLKLRYKNKPGTAAQYHFKYMENIKSVEGATGLAKAIGDSVEGAEGAVTRMIEDKVYGDSVLVRQKLSKVLSFYYAGTEVPKPDLAIKSEYHVEDSTGHVTYVMPSSSPGIPIGVDLPILPGKAVKIGDSWVEPMKIFKYAITGEAAKLNATSTLEGLEWEGGQPCAKIKTQFSGTVRLPYVTVVRHPLTITGEATTYFAYRIGKLISFSVNATAEPEIPTGTLNTWFQQIMSAKNAGGEASAGSSGTGITGGSGDQPVKVKMEFTQVLDLVQ